MPKSTRSADRPKDTFSKPYPDFPLSPHPSGRWCKKVRGKLHYFGRIKGDESGEAGLAEWERVKDVLLAGQTPVKTETPTAPKATKPDHKKPRRDFPLSPHPSGRWCKRVRGKLHYFGRIEGDENGQSALDEWLRVKDDLLAGRKPRDSRRAGLAMVDAVNTFLTVKDQDVKAGEITQRSWNDYDATCVRVLECFGRGRVVEDLRPEDFEQLKARLAKGRNLTTLGNEVQRVRCLFKYLWEADLIPTPVKYGPGFKRPDKKARRRLRNQRGPLLFAADEVRKLIDAAGPTMRAAILLGINAGFGNSDLAELPLDRVDMGTGWHTFGRPKTGVERRCPLWPETVKALRKVIAKRPKPASDEYANRVFLTRAGVPHVRLQVRVGATAEEAATAQTTWNDAISREMGKLLRKLGIHRKGVSFYTLRRTFRTVADSARDPAAASFIMGHADNDSDMGAVYVQGIDDKRLRAVAGHVRRWLFGNAKKKTAPKASESKPGDGDSGAATGAAADKPRLRIVG